MKQGGLILAARRVRSKKTMSKTKSRNIRPTQNTPRNPQQPADRDHLETARDETRPTHYPILARFHRYRLCGNGLAQLSQSVKHNECYTYTDRHTQTL